MKRVFIIHGWSGSVNEPLLVWLKKELDSQGIEAKILKMPNPKKPKLENWIKYIENQVKFLDDETFLIGYSFGCLAILRYLESLNLKEVARGILFIAPWIYMDEETVKEEGEEVIELSRPWMDKPLNWNKIRNHSNNFICIFSDNDPFVPISGTKIFSDKLRAKVIIEKNKGHFDQNLQKMKLNSILNEII